MKKTFSILPALVLSAALLGLPDTSEHKNPEVSITVPAGFKADAIVTTQAANRHIAITKNGDIYVKLEKLKDGKGILFLRKTGNEYKVVKAFGNYTGTAVVIKNNYLYASSDFDVYRYALNANQEVISPDAPERIVTGLVSQNQHASKTIALDNANHLYVMVGAPSNACQVVDRTPGSVGQDPCPILEKAGGVWQFDPAKKDQRYAQGTRYVTGIRNVVALTWNDKMNDLYGVQHGRDQLSTLWPKFYNDQQNAELPSEEFFRMKKGSDFGWPYCYYDHLQQKKVLAPEFGGDGKKEDRCAKKDKPLMGFPGHWAPNDLLFYKGNQFPAKYKDGAFIAFHGSWNRAPLPQGGYNVVFVPFKNGVPSGNYEIFATGFMGKETIQGSGQAKYRPCGLAEGPDGALYVSDDKEGRIWKITYQK